MKRLSSIGIFILVIAIMSGIAFAQAQYLINGGNPLTLTLETAPPNDCATVTIEVDPGGIINTALITAGCWLQFDVSQVVINSLAVADGEVPGPWDPGFTSEVPDADGPGTYMLAVGQFGTVAVDDPIPICDIEFCCEEPGQNQITISTIPGFETIVGDTTVWDPQVADGVIDLTQIITPCRCEIAGPGIVQSDAFSQVTVQYDISSNLQPCDNLPDYLWRDNCTLGNVDQTGLFVVPPTYYGEACEICVTDTANTDINTGEIVECCLPIEIHVGWPPDEDWDGVLDCDDNCPKTPNGHWDGTCTSGTVGEYCNENEDCGMSGYCSMNQEDFYPPGGNECGDACECEGNFDDDEDCDGTDAASFKTDFGRSTFLNPCTNNDFCNGDFDCDGDCDGTDAAKFKEDFGRSPFWNPCPSCPTDPWCTYP